MSTSFTFLRHAQTEANAKGVFSGSSDLPLSKAGEMCAQQTAQILADEHFDAVFYGTAKRVLQTTDYVLSKMKEVPKIILKSNQIREMSFGRFEGLSADEAQDKYPKEWERYMQDWQDFVFPEGDGTRDFYDSCSRFIHDILFEYENNRILIVAHKGFILACWSALLTGEMADVKITEAKTFSLFGEAVLSR